MSNIKVRILGCGSSGGVPRSDGNFGVCDPNNPKNYRTRCSILVTKTSEYGETNILIDTSPDLRQQLIGARPVDIDAVLFTHDHADQCHGIDDLRPFVYSKRHIIKTYIDDETASRLIPKFAYVFKGFENKNYPALCEAFLIDFKNKIIIEGKGGKIEFTPIKLIHGDINCTGFIFENIAYCNDVNIIPQETLEKLNGIDIFIIDALRYTPHPTHAHLEQSIEWSKTIKARHTILTNLHIDMDYDILKSQLPENIEPAFDGMIIEV